MDARAAGCHVWAIEDVKHTKDVPLIQKTASRYFHNHQELAQASRVGFARKPAAPARGGGGRGARRPPAC